MIIGIIKRRVKMLENYFDIRMNWRNIIQLSKKSNNIYLNPKPPKLCRGNIEHYYHFVFDLLLPLSFIIKNTSSNVVFSLKPFGVLTPMVSELFKDRILIDSNLDSLSNNKIDLIGMNPIGINIHYFRFKGLKETLVENLRIQSTKKPNKILLIERITPDVYYLNDAADKGGGTLRRSIKNHYELEKTLETATKENYEFHSVRLENISFKDQLVLFDSAALVIGQHGAGLSNIVWMKEKSVVIEFGFNSKVHFGKLSNSMNHKYFLLNYVEEHIEINCAELLSWLTENEFTRNFFEKDKLFELEQPA